jgi:hypothetical protein
MADCQQEMNGLPILTGCPTPTEMLLVMGSTASGNKAGYGLRPFTDLKKCILAGLTFVLNQFTIGDVGSPMAPGDSSLIITQDNVLQDSVFITLGGPELPRGVTDQLSYGVLYDTPAVGQFTINFLAPVQNTQLYILHYAYSS